MPSGTADRRPTHSATYLFISRFNRTGPCSGQTVESHAGLVFRVGKAPLHRTLINLISFGNMVFIYGSEGSELCGNRRVMKGKSPAGGAVVRKGRVGSPHASYTQTYQTPTLCTGTPPQPAGSFPLRTPAHQAGRDVLAGHGAGLHRGIIAAAQ